MNVRRWRLNVVAGAAVALLLLPPLAAAGEGPGQAGTLEELAARYDSSGCRECHQEIFDQWEKSHHARPLMGLADRVFMAPYLKKGPLAVPAGGKASKRNFPCLKCHLPQFAEAAEAVAEELAQAIARDDKKTLAKLNIGCLTCHLGKAVVHGKPESGVIYGTKDMPDHPGVPVRKSPLLTDSLMCGQCHGLGPVLETEVPVQCAMLYGSYLHAYIPSGGTKTCQDCHMREGGHLMPPNLNDRADFSARLRAALPMDVSVLGYTFQPKEEEFYPRLVVRTRIVSKAGHRIPDG